MDFLDMWHDKIVKLRNQAREDGDTQLADRLAGISDSIADFRTQLAQADDEAFLAFGRSYYQLTMIQREYLADPVGIALAFAEGTLTEAEEDELYDVLK